MTAKRNIGLYSSKLLIQNFESNTNNNFTPLNPNMIPNFTKLQNCFYPENFHSWTTKNYRTGKFSNKLLSSSKRIVDKGSPKSKKISPISIYSFSRKEKMKDLQVL